MTGKKTIPGVPEDWATHATKMQDEVARLGTIIVNARAALEDGRRGDCLKMLKHALPTPTPTPSAAPFGGGGRAA